MAAGLAVLSIASGMLGLVAWKPALLLAVGVLLVRFAGAALGRRAHGERQRVAGPGRPHARRARVDYRDRGSAASSLERRYGIEHVTLQPEPGVRIMKRMAARP